MILHFKTKLKFSKSSVFQSSLNSLLSINHYCHSQSQYQITLPSTSSNLQSALFSSSELPTKPSFYGVLLQSCITQKALNPGKQLHAHIFQMGFGFNPYLATKIVNLYSVCGSLRNAHLLFDRIPKGKLFLWNVLIRGYAWSRPYDVAIGLNHRMNEYGLVPDNFTFPFVLKACSALSAIEEGRKIHEDVIRTQWEKDVFVGAALIDMYAKCSCMESARKVFDTILVRDVVMWNSMIAAYAQNAQADRSLELCREMVMMGGLRPSEATLVTAISASADIAALPQGRELHRFSWRHRFTSSDKVKTSLVDMYAKCGSVKVARNLFEQLKEKRAAS